LTTIGSYQVKVQIESTVEETAFLSFATIEDMPTDWDFDWLSLWQNTSFECQNIIKLVYEGEVWGLVRYGLYPYPGFPKYLEIEHIEAHPTSRGEVAERFIEPIGKWLIWYAIKVGLKSCQTEPDDPLVILSAVEKAVAYYRNKVEMEYVGVAPSAPGEDLYGFRFSRKAAAVFCQRQEREWGVPQLFD
jgi:hypothetical protein